MSLHRSLMLGLTFMNIAGRAYSEFFLEFLEMFMDEITCSSEIKFFSFISISTKYSIIHSL